MSALAEYLRRCAIPGLVVRASRFKRPVQMSAAIRRAFGGPARMQLFFAYDDPYAAVALPGLMAIARQRHADLALYPLAEHGITGDPAALKRRLHAIEDSRRLARRDGRELCRLAPLEPAGCRFLAEWTESARGTPGMNAFAAAALEQLWFGFSVVATPEAFQSLRQKHLGSGNSIDASAALARNSRLLHRLGHWESPAVRVEGEWFFAHERLAQIDAHLQDLGW